jgi:hypothetical protein
MPTQIVASNKGIVSVISGALQDPNNSRDPFHCNSITIEQDSSGGVTIEVHPKYNDDRNWVLGRLNEALAPLRERMKNVGVYAIRDSGRNGKPLMFEVEGADITQVSAAIGSTLTEDGARDLLQKATEAVVPHMKRVHGGSEPPVGTIPFDDARSWEEKVSKNIQHNQSDGVGGFARNRKSLIPR